MFEGLKESADNEWCYDELLIITMAVPTIMNPCDGLNLFNYFAKFVEILVKKYELKLKV